MSLLRQFIRLCVFIILVFFNFSQAESKNTNDIKLIFETKYKDWYEEVERIKSFLGDPHGDFLPSFKEITKLGPSVLPYVIEKMKTDNRMPFAIQAITHKAFGTNELKRVKSEAAFVNFYVDWWNGGQAKAQKDFEIRYQEYKKVFPSGDNKAIAEALRSIKAIGTSSLPYLLRRIEQNEIEFIPIVSKLTDGAVKENATHKECVEWWKKNKNQWLIPFLDQNLWDK